MRYKPLPKDSIIDPEVALLQGASALDAAAVVAERLQDVEGLLNVSAMWMKFGESIQDFTEKVEEAELNAKASQSKIEIGFQAAKPEVDPIIVEEEEDGRVESEE